MLPITRASLQSFCRTCLKEFDEPNKKQLSTVYNIEKTENLSKWLAAICNMKLRATDDTFPRSMCHVCYVKVRTFFEFQEKALCSVEALKELLAEDLEESARKNLQLFCRTCLKKLRTNKSLVNVFEMPHVGDWLQQCIGLEVDTDDFNEFPKSLCLWCFKKLRNYVEFRKISLQSLDYLVNVVGSKNYIEVKREDPNLEENTKNILSADGAEHKVLSDCLATEIKSEPTFEQSSNINLPGKEMVFAEKLPIFKETLDDEDKNIKAETEDNDGMEEKALEVAAGQQIPRKSNRKRRISKTAPQTQTFDEVEHLLSCKEENTDEEPSFFDGHEKSSDFDDPFTKAKLNTEESTKPKSKNVSRKCASTKSSKKIKCNQCDRTFNKAILCEAHILMEHQGLEKPFQCEICNNAFRTFYYLKRHMREKHAMPTADSKAREKISSKQSIAKVMNECQICRRAFKRKEHLRDHHNAVHMGIRPFKCNTCEKTFATRKTCRVHEMCHTGEWPFGCDKCNRKFRQKSELKIHLEIHSENKDLLCPICKRIKSSREELEAHIEYHIASQRHQCPKCGRIFKKISHLNEHDRAVHLKLRPYKCSYCDLSFALPKTCRTHERTHTDKRPELCPVCDQSFKQRSVLSNHMKRYHPNQAEEAKK